MYCDTLLLKINTLSTTLSTLDVCAKARRHTGNTNASTVILNYLIYKIMKFTSIPQNGASWRDRLIYSFDTGSTTPTDVTVEIFDIKRSKSIGRMVLYGITMGEVDIAPFVAQEASLEPIATNRSITIAESPSAIKVAVFANGTTSPQRTFFRAPFDANTAQLLSYEEPTTREIKRGDAIHLTLFAKSRAKVTLTEQESATTTPIEATYATNGTPLEVVVATTNISPTASVIYLTIECDDGLVQNFSYRLTDVNSKGQTLLWYNYRGGIESHTFAHSIPISYEAEISDGQATCDTLLREAKGAKRERLCTGYETTATTARVVELLLTPAIYKVVGNTTMAVEMATKSLECNGKGGFNTVAIDIVERWKGGDYEA